MRAIKKTFPDLDSISALNECNIPTLEVVRVSLRQNVFRRMQDNKTTQQNLTTTQNQCYEYSQSPYLLQKTHINSYKKSFFPYALYNLQ